MRWKITVEEVGPNSFEAVHLLRPGQDRCGCCDARIGWQISPAIWLPVYAISLPSRWVLLCEPCGEQAEHDQLVAVITHTDIDSPGVVTVQHAATATGDRIIPLAHT